MVYKKVAGDTNWLVVWIHKCSVVDGQTSEDYSGQARSTKSEKEMGHLVTLLLYFGYPLVNCYKKLLKMTKEIVDFPIFNMVM